MKKMILILLLCSYSELFCIELKYSLFNTKEDCTNEQKIWLLDNNSDDRIEYLVYSGCNENATILNVTDNSKNTFDISYKAILKTGKMTTEIFTILMLDSVNLRYTHKIYCNGSHQVIIEDYKDFDDDFQESCSTDNYFITYQIGDIVVLTKKTDIQINSFTVVNIQGAELFSRYAHESETTYYLDFKSQSSGIYLIKFIIFDSELMIYKPILKKIIYLN